MRRPVRLPSSTSSIHRYCCRGDASRRYRIGVIDSGRGVRKCTRDGIFDAGLGDRRRARDDDQIRIAARRPCRAHFPHPFLDRHHLQSGVGRITPIPNATLGTLWLAPGESGASLDEVVAYRYNVAAQQNLITLDAVLLANAGKTVTVTYNNKDYTGEIVGLRDPDSNSPNAAPSPNPDLAANAPVIAPPAKPQYLLLRVDKKLVALPASGISNAVLPDDAIFTEKIEQQRSALRFKVKGAAEKTRRLYTRTFLSGTYGSQANPADFTGCSACAATITDTSSHSHSNHSHDSHLNGSNSHDAGHSSHSCSGGHGHSCSGHSCGGHSCGGHGCGGHGCGGGH